MLCLQQAWKAFWSELLWAQLVGVGGFQDLQPHTDCPTLRDLLCPGAGGSTVQLCPGGPAERLAALRAAGLVWAEAIGG